MQLRQIRDFLALRQNNFSISQTALELNKAQSSLSRSLLMLEDELQHPIFVRKGRRLLGLTAFGESLVDEFEKIALLQDNVMQKSKFVGQVNAGVINIATTHTQARYFIPNVVLGMRKRYPQIEINLQQGNPTQLMQMLRTRESDFAVCTEAIESQSDLAYQSCYHWRHVIIVPKDHKLAQMQAISLSELSEFPLVTYVFGFTGRSYFQDRLKSLQLDPKIALSATDTDVIKHYVRLGVGVGVIANICYEPNLDGDLRTLEITDDQHNFDTKIAWLKEKYLTATMRHTLQEVLLEGHKTHTTTSIDKRPS